MALGTAGIYRPWCITGVGVLLHVLWDWVHHAMRKLTVGRWWPPFCAICDVLVGGYLLVVGFGTLAE